MSDPVSTEFLVRTVSAVRHSPNGHPYVETVGDRGVVAFWGSPGNMGHIEAVSQAPRPFRIVCDCIQSKWRQHDAWVYERDHIYSIEPLRDDSPPAAESTGTPNEDVSIQDLTSWRRQIAGWVAVLEQRGGSSSDSLAGRIGALSRSGAVPREVAALMRTVTEMRNAAEYDSKVLSRFESVAVKNAWLAIGEWAAAKGLRS
jgi:hypothetical protein